MSDEERRARQLRENRDLPARAEPEEAALRRRNDEEGQGSRANYYPKSFQLVIAPVIASSAAPLERSPSHAVHCARHLHTQHLSCDIHLHTSPSTDALI